MSSSLFPGAPPPPADAVFPGGASPTLSVIRWRVLAQWQAGRDSSSGMLEIVKALRA